MNNKDNHLIYEAYASKQGAEHLEEGFFDRAKAGIAGVVGTAKGLGNQAKGYTKSAISGIKGDTAGVAAGQEQVKAGKSAGSVAKIESYKKSAINKLNSVTDEIFSDLEKMGVSLKGVSAKGANVFKKNLEKAFDTLISDLKK